MMPKTLEDFNSEIAKKADKNTKPVPDFGEEENLD